MWKDLLFVMGKAFVCITLWYTNTTPGVLLCEAPTTLIPCWPHQVVVVFYWPLGSKQISRSIYIHITHTKHGKKLTSAHQSNKEINIASVSVDFVWYNRDFFYISIAQNFMKRASPVLALGPRKFPGTGANSRPARPSGTRSVTVDRHMRKYRNGQQ